MSLVFYTNKTSEKQHAKMNDTSDDKKNDNAPKGDNKNEGNHHLSIYFKLDSSAVTITTASSTEKLNSYDDWKIKNKQKCTCKNKNEPSSVLSSLHPQK